MLDFSILSPIYVLHCVIVADAMLRARIMPQKVAASTCFCKLRRLRQIKRHIAVDAMKHLVAAVILDRLDYCNSVLAGLPWSTIAPLQRVQNAAASLVLSLSLRDHVSPAFVELHWLPIHHLIQFKLAILMYMAHIGQSPVSPDLPHGILSLSL